MGKVTLILLLVVALIFWLRLKTNAKPGASIPPKSPGQPAADQEMMVACAQCGLHLPASEAVLGRSARAYCGVVHRAKALDGPPA